MRRSIRSKSPIGPRVPPQPRAPGSATRPARGLRRVPQPKASPAEASHAKYEAAKARAEAARAAVNGLSTPTAPPLKAARAKFEAAQAKAEAAREHYVAAEAAEAAEEARASLRATAPDSGLLYSGRAHQHPGEPRVMRSSSSARPASAPMSGRAASPPPRTASAADWPAPPTRQAGAGQRPSSAQPSGRPAGANHAGTWRPPTKVSKWCRAGCTCGPTITSLQHQLRRAAEEQVASEHVITVLSDQIDALSWKAEQEKRALTKSSMEIIQSQMKNVKNDEETMEFRALKIEVPSLREYVQQLQNQLSQANAKIAGLEASQVAGDQVGRKLSDGKRGGSPREETFTGRRGREESPAEMTHTWTASPERQWTAADDASSRRGHTPSVGQWSSGRGGSPDDGRRREEMARDGSPERGERGEQRLRGSSPPRYQVPQEDLSWPALRRKSWPGNVIEELQKGAQNPSGQAENRGQADNRSPSPSPYGQAENPYGQVDNRSKSPHHRESNTGYRLESVADQMSKREPPSNSNNGWFMQRWRT